MKNFILKLEVPEYYSLFAICRSHGWVNLAPFNFCEDSQTLNFALEIENRSFDVSIRQKCIEITAIVNHDDDLKEKHAAIIKNAIIRILDLNTNTEELLKQAHRAGQEYVRIVKAGAGRLLRSATLWEDAAKTLFTTNCSWNLTKKMCNAACSENFTKCTTSGVFPFPSPDVFIKFSASQIKTMIPIGYRAEYFLELAKVFSEDPNLNNIEDKRLHYAEAYNLVKNLKGFGKYASTHLLILSGYFDEIPVDTVVMSYLKRNYNFRKPLSFINRHYGKWGRFKWWGMKLEKMIKNQNWLGD